MNKIIFDGQQSDEVILYTILPHPISHTLGVIRTVFLAIFFTIVLFLIASILPTLESVIRLVGIVLGVVICIIGVWWTNTVYIKDKTYITDRRIIRFDVASPFFVAKRALFWNEVLKVKAYAPNLIYRAMKIGTLEVEPQLAESQSVHVSNVYYFEDLANYIDKILFTFKNKPAEVALLHSFVPKGKGQRDLTEQG